MLNLAALFFFLGLSIVSGAWFGGYETLPVAIFVCCLIYWSIRIWAASKERAVALVREYGMRFIAAVFGLLLGSFISIGINVFVAENVFMLLGLVVLFLVQTNLVVSILPDAREDEMIPPIALSTATLFIPSLFLVVLHAQAYPIGQWDVWYFFLGIIMLVMTPLHKRVRSLYAFVFDKLPVQ